MATKTMSAWEARRNFGKLINEVTRSQQPVMVESHGEQVVAVVPAQMLRVWQEESDRFFETARIAAERANMTEEEAMALVNEVIAEVRAEQDQADE